MSLRSAVEAGWLSPNGLLIESPGVIGGNAPYSTGIYYALLHIVGDGKPEDADAFTAAIQTTQLEPGLYLRYNGDTTLNSHDNMMGVAFGSFFLGTSHRFDIYSYGKRHWWYFNNTDTKVLAAWHVRFGWVVPFYKLCAGDELNWFERQMIRLKFTKDRHNFDNDSAKILTWMIYEVCRRRGLFEEERRLWRSHITSVYGSIGVVFGNQFGFEHPYFIHTFQSRMIGETVALKLN